MGGKHRSTFAAQRTLIDDVLRIAFQVDQLAVFYMTNHSASARTEVARGRKFRRTFQLLLSSCRNLRRIHQHAGGDPSRKFQQVASIHTHSVSPRPSQVSPRARDRNAHFRALTVSVLRRTAGCEDNHRSMRSQSLDFPRRAVPCAQMRGSLGPPVYSPTSHTAENTYMAQPS